MHLHVRGGRDLVVVLRRDRGQVGHGCVGGCEREHVGSGEANRGAPDMDRERIGTGFRKDVIEVVVVDPRDAGSAGRRIEVGLDEVGCPDLRADLHDS